MRTTKGVLFGTLLALSSCLSAQTIGGTITIKKRLTKRSVTPPVSVYQRGTSVKLAKESEADPISYELSRVVVYLEGPLDKSGDATTAETRKIDQIDRRFVPDLVVVPVGATVSFPNMDPIFHNIYSLSKAKAFDLGSYDKGQTRTVTFSKAGIVEVYCHLHPNMEATVIVTPNRWYARPGPDGQYRIEDVPAGKYTLVAWHKSAGFFRKTITVSDSQNASADFLIPVDVDSDKGPEIAESERAR